MQEFEASIKNGAISLKKHVHQRMSRKSHMAGIVQRGMAQIKTGFNMPNI